MIGDSFVEGAQLSNKDTIGEVIASKAKDINVYQLGVPGVPIAQFIHMVRYAEKEFQPKNYLIVITSNDFDESICEYRINLGAWCFNDNFKLKFVPFEGHGLIRKIAQNSAFLRYIVFNLNIDWRLFIRTDDGVNNIDKYAGNTERIKSKVLVDSSKKVIESFFEFIKKMKLNDKVTLIVDTDRQDIYGQKYTDSYFRDMRSFLKKMAVINQVTIIDLEEVFMEDFNNYGKRFEFPTDGHWNKRAHRLAAEAYLNKQ